jgi:hypothetical protein
MPGFFFARIVLLVERLSQLLRGETNALWIAIIHTGSQSAISANVEANSFKKNSSLSGAWPKTR